MDAMFAAGDDLDKEGETFILQHPYTTRIASGVHPKRVGVRESINHSLSPGFSNAGLNND